MIGQLVEQFAIRDSEVDRLNMVLEEKDREIDVLEERIRNNGQSHVGYAAFKGDAVDEQLAKYINMMQCQVPIKRLGNGYYLFGTRKIFAKIMNGKLVTRVGGGYMVIEEFIANYADQEITRCKMLEAQQLSQQQEAALAGGDIQRRGSANLKKQGSPRFNASPRPGSGGATRLSGSLK